MKTSRPHNVKKNHDDRDDRDRSTDKSALISVRVSGDRLLTLDNWIASRDDPDLSRPEAIRRLIDLLGSARLDGPTNGRQRARANEIAGVALDQMADKTASVEDQETRKSRLLKGPSEFRDVRKDRKAKS